jgi:hypothetical protein
MFGFFPENVGDLSVERRERFHKNTFKIEEVKWKMESRYVG